MGARTKTRREKGRRLGMMAAVASGTCSACGREVRKGDFVRMGGEGGWRHARCRDVERQRKLVRGEARRRGTSPVEAAVSLLEEWRR